MGGRQGGWERGEAAVALETTGDLKRQPPLLGAVVRLLNLRGVAEQQQRQSGQLPQPRIGVPESICAGRNPAQVDDGSIHLHSTCLIFRPSSETGGTLA